MATTDDVLELLAVPPARREETREVTVSVCQAAGCGKEHPGWPEGSAWVQLDIQGRQGRWALYFCGWAHVADYATAAAELIAKGSADDVA